MNMHYIDFTVIPDEETCAPSLIAALYEKLHLALVRAQTDSIGISFPNYCQGAKTVGSVMRLHGSEKALSALMVTDWLKGIRDYVRVARIAPVPADVEHRIVYRRQFKTNVERLRRRRMKRKGETVEEAIKAIPEEVARKSSLPCVWMRSQSTKQHFCLFIGVSPPLKTPIPGRFSCYGLSTEATIPWF